MPLKLQHRDVAGFLSRVRNFLLGRTHKTALRFADTVSPRTQPPPEIPQGPSQSLAGNYNYYLRDPRGQLKPSVDVVEDHKQQLAAKEKAAEAAEAAKAAEPKEAVDCDQQDKEEAGDREQDEEVAGDRGQDEEEACDGDQDEEEAGDRAKKLPTPGRVHSWEGPN